MTASSHNNPRRWAFTLIELLTVIAIMGVLAAIIVPLAGHASATAKLKEVSAQKDQLATWIERYKDARGHYPPDNTADVRKSALFYELTGTQFDPATRRYQTINGGEVIDQAILPTWFNISGFANTSMPGNSDDAQKARNFATGMTARQHAEVSTNPDIELLVSRVEGPAAAMLINPATTKPLNPWHYRSSNPSNNLNAFDLWIDIRLGSKHYRICNWSDKPIAFTPP